MQDSSENPSSRSRPFLVADTERQVAICTVAFEDNRLSFKAMGIHAFIRTQLDGKTVCMANLLQGSNDGEFAIRSGIKELMQYKYLYLVQLRDEAGKVNEAVYISLPKPIEIDQEILTKIVSENYLCTNCAKTISPLETTGQPYFRRYIYNYDYIYPSNAGHINNNYKALFTLALRPSGRKESNKGTTASSRRKEIAEKLFAAWNRFEGLQKHREGEQYKTYRTSIKHLCAALKHHSPMVIKQAMANYAWILRQPYTTLWGKERPVVVGLDEFFQFNSYSEKIRSKKGHPLCAIVSWFEEAKKGKVYLDNTYSQLKRDANPTYTEALTRAVLGSGRFGVNGTEGLTSMDKNQLIKASGLLAEFVERNKDRLPKRAVVGTCLQSLMAYLTGSGGKFKRLHLGYLASEITWKELENHMLEHGVMEKALTRARARK